MYNTVQKSVLKVFLQLPVVRKVVKKIFVEVATKNHYKKDVIVMK